MLIIDRHAKRVYKEFNNKNLGDFHHSYVKGDTLLLADVFENFRNKCIKIHELDPAHFLSASRSAWEAALKKTKIELELLTNTDTLLMVEKKELEEVYAMQHIDIQKQIISIWKNMIKTKNHHTYNI